MARITEDYVSFEVAKLLEEKGFNEYCPKSYFKMDKTLKESGFSEWEKVNEIKAPTQSLAMKWLRKVHNIHIELNWDKGNQLYSFQIWKLGKYQPEISSLDLWRNYKDDNYLGEWNYEEAAEEAIKYCLKYLI